MRYYRRLNVRLYVRYDVRFMLGFVLGIYGMRIAQPPYKQRNSPNSMLGLTPKVANTTKITKPYSSISDPYHKISVPSVS